MYFKLISLLIIFTSSYAFACEPKTIISKTNTVMQNLDDEQRVLEDAINGKHFDKILHSSLFGFDFNLNSTQKLIDDLLKKKMSDYNIPDEFSSIVECLSRLEKMQLREKVKIKYNQVIDKKIHLLRKNNELNDSLRVAGQTESELPQIRGSIDEQSNLVKKEKSLLEDKLLGQSSKNKEDAFESQLTKTKINLLSAKLEINKNLENKIRYFENSTDKLKKLALDLSSNDQDILKENFFKAETLWRALLKENYLDFFNQNHSLDLPKTPLNVQSNLAKDSSDKFEQLKDEVKKLRTQVILNYSEKKNQELILLNSLVITSNKLREDYFNKLEGGILSLGLSSMEILSRIKNELLSSPYRVISYIYGEYISLIEIISQGRKGYISLSFQVIWYLFIVGILFTTNQLLIKFAKNIDIYFQKYFFANKSNYLLKKAFLFWRRVKDIFVDSVWLGVTLLILEYKLLDEFYLITKAFSIIFMARILKTFVTLFLGKIAKVETGTFSVFKKKSDETSQKFKNIVLFYFLSMFFLEITVGKVYIYSFVKVGALLYLSWLFVVESSRWEIELKKYSERMFSGVLVDQLNLFLRFVPKIFKSCISLLFIILFSIFDIFIQLTENLEISKKISANLFKKQIQKVEASENDYSKISADYKDRFSFKSTMDEKDFVSNINKIEENVFSEVGEWILGSSEEHSLVIYGDKGIGKTTLLKKIGRQLQEKHSVDIIYTKMPAKSYNKSDLESFVHQLFSEEKKNEDFSIYNYDSQLDKKTIVILDEAQNIFLSKAGGFESYYAFINILNLHTKNIFWMMSFNKYSWLFLDRAFGRTQFFRNVFELKGWSDDKIRELIMRRHNGSGLKLSYDLLISATRSQDEIDKYTSVESKFFKLLWELSRGNPRAALSLWISALSKKNRTTLNVNIPKENEVVGLDKLSDETLFVISQVFRHENLSSEEIEIVTNLPKGIVRNCIKQSLEKKFLFRDQENRYMVDISTQNYLLKLLKTKNFIYGN